MWKYVSAMRLMLIIRHLNVIHLSLSFSFYPRWKEYEMLQAAVLNYTLAETQWEIDWTTLLSLANQPGSSLEQIHIFALSHIMRRVNH